MNRVPRTTPLPHLLHLLERDGYLLLEDALLPEELARVRAAYYRVLAEHPRAPNSFRTEVPRIIERDPDLAMLMDLPTVFRLPHAIYGATVELASGGELDHKFGQSPAHIGWHNDFLWMVNTPYPRHNFWLRCTYFIEDVMPDMGPFTVLPGTHKYPGPCPRDYNQPTGQPKIMPGQVGMVGKAGTCLINNTELWHTNTPSQSDRARPLIMILYKHGWMKSWLEGYEISPAFAAAQTDPLRRQLCGQFVWHHGAEKFPAAKWQPPA